MCFSSTRKLAEDAAAAATTTDNSEVLVENPSKCSSENVSLLKWQWKYMWIKHC